MNHVHGGNPVLTFSIVILSQLLKPGPNPIRSPWEVFALIVVQAHGAAFVFRISNVFGDDSLWRNRRAWLHFNISDLFLGLRMRSICFHFGSPERLLGSGCVESCLVCGWWVISAQLSGISCEFNSLLN